MRLRALRSTMPLTHRAALSQELAARRIAHVCNSTGDGSPKIIVEKSTVPVKTADAMARVMAASCTSTNFQARRPGTRSSLARPHP